MKNYLLTALLMILSLSVFSQKKKDIGSVSYNLLDDDPDKYNFHAALVFFNGDYSSNQSVMLGYGLQGSVTIKKLVTADFFYEKPYADITDMNYHFATKSAYAIITSNVPVNYSHYEFGGMFHLRDHEKTKKRSITLSSGERSRTYITIPVTVRSIFGVRGGFYHNAMALTDYDHGALKDGIKGVGKGGVIADDGTEFGGAVTSYDSPFYNTKAVTNMHVNGFYAGICKAQQYDVTIDAGGYGEKRSRVYSKWYIDAIIAPPVIDDFTVNGKDYKVSGGNAKGFDIRSTGFRIGHDGVSGGGRVAFYAHYELGVKPGLKNHKFYIAAGFGLAFRGKIKPLAPGK
jgi:hypothetical protein